MRARYPGAVLVPTSESRSGNERDHSYSIVRTINKLKLTRCREKGASKRRRNNAVGERVRLVYSVYASSAMAELTRRILIIDDEPSLLRMMSVYLGRLGYAVTVAASAGKARAALKSDPAFDVVVLDATLPGVTLAELGREILTGAPDVRMIAASGYPIDMSTLEAAAPDRVMFLHKPFSPEMLAAAVRRMIGAQEEGV
jgi:two-component system cell cycle response regulator CpdR